MPEISVIVPVYNVEKYLKRCIDSILEQTFSDFELLLIDDGSKDKSGEICDQYAEKDDRIKALHKENGGLSDARNHGIDRALGHYIAFVDSDDWIKKDFLQVLYDNAIRHDADIAVVNLHKEYDNMAEVAEPVACGVFSNREVFSYLYQKTMAIYMDVACNKLYARALFEDIRYPVGRLHEDGFTTYKLFYKAKKVHLSDADLYCYYQRRGSIMNQEFSEKRVDEYFVYKERAAFFKEKKLDEVFVCNEKRRLSCMKTLTIKIMQSQSKDKRKWLRIFKDDVKENYAFMTDGAVSWSTEIFHFSPWLFYGVSRLKEVLRCMKRGGKEISVLADFVCSTAKAKLFSKKKTAFVFMTPIGGNLGDQALMLTENKLFEDLHLIEMPCPYTNIYFKYLRVVKKIISKSLILFNAGGYLGTLWYEEAEVPVRKCIDIFKDNPIIILPQTCYYEDSDWGRKEFEISKKIYNAHENLKIYTREKISYDMIKDQYQNVALMPDMVMYLDEIQTEYARSGALICLRGDVEKTMGKEKEQEIFAVVKRIFSQVEVTDTVINGIVGKKEREEKIAEKLMQFKKAEIVITDRLHGMVFAAITGTPCVVLQSKSHKLQGCYAWIDNLEYIQFAEDAETLENACKTLPGKKYRYNNAHLKQYFDTLRMDVYKAAQGENHIG